MPAGVDLTGQTFGLWRVLRRAKKTGNGRYWLCACECGTRRIIAGGVIRMPGETRSCGCARGRNVAARITRHGHAANDTETPEYRVWKGIKTRCLNRRASTYREYGGRGIRMHPEWVASFEAFLRDMGPRPAGKSIDRIDPRGHYVPSNCRWATPSEQQNNLIGNRHVTVDGVRLTVRGASKRFGIDYAWLRRQLYLTNPAASIAGLTLVYH